MCSRVVAIAPMFDLIKSKLHRSFLFATATVRDSTAPPHVHCTRNACSLFDSAAVGDISPGTPDTVFPTNVLVEQVRIRVVNPQRFPSPLNLAISFALYQDGKDVIRLCDFGDTGAGARSAPPTREIPGCLGYIAFPFSRKELIYLYSAP